MTIASQLGDAEQVGYTMRRGLATSQDGHEDDRLVALVLSGDKGAFAAIVARHQGAVRRLAYRHLGGADDADDATQETFLRAYSHLTSYRPGSSLRAWLLSIADNWCRDRLRQRHAERRRSTRLEMLAAGIRRDDNLPEARVLRAEVRADVRRGFAGLPAHYRQILTLRYEQGLSYDEIGRELDSPVSTVRMRLFRAHRRLARGLRLSEPGIVPACGAD